MILKGPRNCGALFRIAIGLECAALDRFHVFDQARDAAASPVEHGTDLCPLGQEHVHAFDNEVEERGSARAVGYMPIHLERAATAALRASTPRQ